MNCEQTKPHLAAYADGSLGSLIREEVAEHLATCAVCRDQVERAQAEIASKEEIKANTGSWTSKLRLIPTRAMGPQLSMAMVLLLMVGVGLVYLPKLQRGAGLEGGRLIDGSSPGRSDGIMPAARLDLALDPRNHRIRTREEEAAMEEAAAIAARALASRDAGIETDAGPTTDGGAATDAAAGVSDNVVPTPDTPLAPPAPTETSGTSDAPHPEKLPPETNEVATSAGAPPANAVQDPR